MWACYDCGMSTTVLDLPDTISRALDEVGERTGRSRAEVILEAVQTFLERQERRPTDPGWPRSIGMIDAPDAPNAADLEDWFKANWRPEDDWERP